MQTEANQIAATPTHDEFKANLSAKAGPTISVTGISKLHALRAIKWMSERNLLAWYRSDDDSLNAFEFKKGHKWTDDVMRRALAETRNGARYLPPARKPSDFHKSKTGQILKSVALKAR